MNFKFLQKYKCCYSHTPVIFIGSRSMDGRYAVGGLYLVQRTDTDGWPYNGDNPRSHMCSETLNKVKCFGLTEKLFWVSGTDLKEIT